MIAEGQMIEHGFDMRLAIIKCAFQRKGMDIGRGHRGHLSPLHFAHAAMRIQDEDIHLLKP